MYIPKLPFEVTSKGTTLTYFEIGTNTQKMGKRGD
jgi:hypothetical protein